MIPYNQLSLADIFSDCQEIYESDKPQFLSLLQQHIDLDEIIPASFRKHFYASTGRTRKYPLHAFLWALIIQRIFSIPTDSLLLVFLHYSRHLREFCGFDKVPDASKITRFKQDFLEDIQAVFERLVDLTGPICHAIDSCKADMTIFDSSGIEAWNTGEQEWIEHFKEYRNIRELTRKLAVALIERIDVYEGKKIHILFRFQMEYDSARMLAGNIAVQDETALQRETELRKEVL